MEHPWIPGRKLSLLPEHKEIQALVEKLDSQDLFPALRERLETKLPKEGILILSYAMYEEKSIQGYNLSLDFNPPGYSFLARVMRSSNPGIVYGHAALNKAMDPLTDPWAAAFCGIVPRKDGSID